MVYTLQVHVTITPKTARTNCSSPVMANATKIGLQYERRPIAVPCWEKLFTMEAMICVIFRPGHVHRDIMSTVSAMYTGQQSTTLLRAKTLADTIRMADAIITQATVRTVIIRLTVNAIVKPAGIPAQHALKLVDITISRPHQQALMEPAIITVSTVMGSLLISSTAWWIVQRRTAEQHAWTLAVSAATMTLADTMGPPAAMYIQMKRTTVCTTPSTVLGKQRHCVLITSVVATSSSYTSCTVFAWVGWHHTQQTTIAELNTLRHSNAYEQC